MIRSMTAFARRERHGEWGVLTWELRTVNHRYLEVSARLPEELRTLEGSLREHAARFLGRGKLDCTLRFQPSAGATAEITVNAPLAQRLMEACDQLEAAMSRAAPVSALDLLRWPGVVQKAEPDMEPIVEAALALLDETLAELVETRGREGARLREMIEQRCIAIAGLAADARRLIPEILARLRTRLEARLAEVATGADPARLEQELVIQIQKLDVAEELDRLESHVQEVRDVLARDEPVGRRLDFLMQELNREANTLGSKSADAETTRVSVELKVLIEQMREQIQNIE